MQLSLYRAERPEIFEDIIGQKQIVRILRNQIRNNSVSQAYLFAGTHGTGKTSTARILAKAVNCESPNVTDGEGPVPCGECENCRAIKEGRFVDVIEMDAASNNRVEDFRALIDLVKYPPSIGRYKVYIIDEVHMLTQQAENAFLKTLEEPPEYVIFILATTDPQKVRETIRSRCMQLNFKRVSESELVEGMRRITERNSVQATEGALVEIASMANGSVRDALSILDQCMAAGDSRIDTNLVLEYTGTAGMEFFVTMTDCVIEARVGDAMVAIARAVEAGKDARQLLKDWMEHYRNLLICKYVEKADRLLCMSPENLSRLRAQAENCDVMDIDRAIRLLSEYINLARYSDKPRILMETAVVRLAGEGAQEVSGGERAQRRPVNLARTSAAAEPVRLGASGAEPGGEPDKMTVSEESSGEKQKEACTENPADVWRNVVSAISRFDNSFETLVGANSAAESFEDKELHVVVKKSKLSFAEDVADEIDKAIKGLYGSEARVTLKAGDAASVRSAGSDKLQGAPGGTGKAPGDRESGGDKQDISELVSSIENVLGFTGVEIVE